MDILPWHVAKLVLGYLKLQKCEEAYTSFLNASQHLKSFRNTKRRKYISTRVHGQNLEDILSDYAKMHNIIEAAVEDTDFFNDKHHSKSIVHQLLYLLENKVPSRSTTPNCSSRCSTPVNRYTSDEISAIEKSGELDATPLKSLPGNHPDDQSSSDASRHKQKQRNREDDASEERNDSAHLETAIQAFAQTLLDHQELQEKIAENINIVRHTEPVKEKEKVGADDLDAAIKAVLDKTQSDPAFEVLIGDIIGSVADPASSVEATEKTPVPQTTSTPHSSAVKEQQIEDQNNVAINSIISASQVNEVMPNRMEVNPSPEIILSGPLPQVSQPLLLNPSGLLMMKPNQSSTSTTDAVKPFLVFNGPHIVNIPQQEPAYVNNLTILTEQDILNMPTVILRDDKDKNVITDQIATTSKTKEALEKSAELITLYKCDLEESASEKNKPKVAAAQKKKPSTIIHVEIVPDDEQTPKVETPAVPVKDQPEITPTTEATQENKSVATPRSSNRSHIRALDFNFHTPNKEAVNPKKKTPNKTKSAKSLFKSPDKGKTSSWDSDLRALASSGLPTVNKPLTKKPAVRRKVPEPKTEPKRLKTRFPKKVEIEAAEIKIEPVEVAEYKIRNADNKLKYKKKCNVEVVLKTDADSQPEAKFLTPEVVQPMVKNNPVSSAKRNVIPSLETPIKEFNLLPKTPGFYSPLNAFDTPFTKVFKENFQTVDIASIPTPKFPLTPSFPFTPLMEGQSPHSNYSTSSSYYQPSDTEQSKSLETIIIEECKRLENKKITPPPPPPVEVEKAFVEKFKTLSANVIARKNLNLLKRKPESSESSSDDSSSDTSSDESEHNTSTNSKERYSLRSKTIVEDPPKKEITVAQNQVLKELEEKRRRTIAKLTEPKKKTKIKTPAVKRNLRSNSKKIDLELHLSSDDDNIQPMDVVETEMLSSKSTTPQHDTRDAGVTTFGNVLNNLESDKTKTETKNELKKEAIKEKNIIEDEDILEKTDLISTDKETIKKKPAIRKKCDEKDIKKKSDNKKPVNKVKILDNIKVRSPLKQNEAKTDNKEEKISESNKGTDEKSKKKTESDKLDENISEISADCKKIIEDLTGDTNFVDGNKPSDEKKKSEAKTKLAIDTKKPDEKKPEDNKKTLEEEAKKSEDNEKKLEEEAKKSEDNKKKLEEAKKSEDNKKKLEEVKKSEDNKKKLEEEAKKSEDNKKKLEEAKKSEDKKKLEDEKKDNKKLENEKKKSDYNKKKLEDEKKKSLYNKKLDKKFVDKKKLEDKKKKVEPKRRSPIKKRPNLVPRSTKKKPETEEAIVEITKLDNDKKLSTNREEDLLAGLKQMGIHLVPNKPKPQQPAPPPPVEDEYELGERHFTDHEIVTHGEYKHNHITWNTDQIKPIKFTSDDDYTFMLTLGKFESTIDLSPKTEKKPIVILEQVTLPGKLKPLETLYKQLVEPSDHEIKSRALSEIKTHSPLENLYDEPKRRKSLCEEKHYSVERMDMELEVCRSGSILVRENPVVADDDLMNYAICGSERKEDDCDKRKRQEDDGEREVKKAKPDNGEELLKSVNVDDFLKQLHGE